MAARNICPGPNEEEDDFATNFSVKLKLKSSVADDAKLVVNILSRVPVKHLLRCKSVCKSWYSLISSPQFIRTQLSRSLNNPYLTHHRLILCDAPFIPQKNRPYIDVTVRNEDLKLACCSLVSLLYNNTIGPKQIPLARPKKNLDNWTYVVDCCNGLVCLACFDGRVYLWNPSTRKCRRLPKYEHEQEHTVFGFGYNESKDDFKVYAVVGDSVSVYSTVSDCWEMIQDVPIPELSPLSSKGIFAHGAIHWIVSQGDDEKETVCALDVKTETSRKVLQPNYGKDVYELTLGILGNGLSVLCQNRSGADLWVVQGYGMEESWEKLFTFPFPTDLKWKPRIRPICISVYGDFMLLVDSVVIMYNPKEKVNQIKTLFETERNPSYNMFQELNVYTFVESLVSPQI